jgi:formylglycine-generating enzyme required for sulfatase activity
MEEDSAGKENKSSHFMKKILLILVLVASFKNNSFSQIKLLKKAYETESLNDSVLVARREVSIQDWMGFLVYNKFDSLLFPNNSDISPTTKILFNTFKNYNSKYFHPTDINAYKKSKIRFFILGGFYKPGIQVVYLSINKSDAEALFKDDTTNFSITVPVTGITYQQAVAFCKWKEDMINSSQKIKVKVSLPSIEIYKEILDNRDSLNLKKCSLYNFKDCNCKIEKNQRDRKSQGKCLQDVYSYWPNTLGLYNLQGNAAEMTSTEGIAMGGSFRHSARETFRDRKQEYSKPENWLGFRYVVTIISK